MLILFYEVLNIGKISITLDDIYLTKLKKEAERRTKDLKKFVGVSEVARKYITYELDWKEVSKPKIVEQETTTDVNKDIAEIKESLNEILTIVSYPKDIQRLDEIKAILQRITQDE